MSDNKLNINLIRGYELKDNPGDYVTVPEIRKMLEACDGMQDANRNWILIYLLGVTGKRINEILHLRKSDINFDDNMIRFSILKRRKNFTKWKPYPDKLFDKLKIYLSITKLEELDYIFQGTTSKKSCFERLKTKIKVNGKKKYISTLDCKGGHLGDRAVLNLIKRISKRADLETIRGISPHAHMFRKGVVTRMIKRMSEEGDSLDKIIKAADYMDWKDINYVIKIYYMYNPKSKRIFAEFVSDGI